MNAGRSLRPGGSRARAGKGAFAARQSTEFLAKYSMKGMMGRQLALQVRGRLSHDCGDE